MAFAAGDPYAQANCPHRLPPSCLHVQGMKDISTGRFARLMNHKKECNVHLAKHTYIPFTVDRLISRKRKRTSYQVSVFHFLCMRLLAESAGHGRLRGGREGEWWLLQESCAVRKEDVTRTLVFSLRGLPRPNSPKLFGFS